MEVTLQSENGMLGMGPFPGENEVDPDLINAGKQTITQLPKTSFFSSADSFAMIRGGHIDICVLGAYEVAENGDLANWILPDKKQAPAVGGAMDLAAGARKVFVMMDFCSKDGAPKLLKQCTLPLTGVTCVTSIYTDIAVIDRTDNGFVVREIVDGIDLDYLQARCGARLRLADNWRPLTAPPIEPPAMKQAVPPRVAAKSR
jgi:3-oxoacid CoA-transferase B subunit